MTTSDNQRRIVAVEVFSFEEYEDLKTLPDFIRWLQGLLEEIPEEYRSKTRVVYRSGDYSRFDCKYYRMQTDEELAAVVAHDEIYKHQREESERRTYEILKQKFEP